MRITVGNIFRQLSIGRNIENLLEDFLPLEKEGVLEAMKF